MPVFKPGTPVTTEEPVVEVIASEELPLKPGRHRLQLIVEDDSGNVSLPDIVDLIVRDTIRPTAVLEAPKSVQPGQNFMLDGRRSSDVPPGKIVKYEWTLLE